jgi:DNA-binding NarL/FixJ family response regulator
MKLLLVDPQALYREGLALLITRSFPELELLQAGTIAEELAQLELHPDLSLVLLDLELPDVEGAHGLRRIRSRAPGVTVVVLSGDTPPEILLEAIQADAAGFIPKGAPAGFMQKTLRRIIDSGACVPPTPPTPPTPPALRLRATDGAPEPVPATTSSLAELTPRQRDVLRLLIEGKTNKLICRELELSESTVKTHLASIFRRLGATSRTQAVVAAARMGLRLGPAAGAAS